MENTIKIRGARENNLKNINLDIPRDKLVIMTGVSGSGKTSLAFDTIYAEGQRRYMESLSAYARQFLGNSEKPDVDQIDGLSRPLPLIRKPHPTIPVPLWGRLRRYTIICAFCMPGSVFPTVRNMENPFRE